MAFQFCRLHGLYGRWTSDSVVFIVGGIYDFKVCLKIGIISMFTVCFHIAKEIK